MNEPMSLADLAKIASANGNPNYSRLPASGNVDDRRGFSLANIVADYVNRARGAASGPSDPDRHSNPFFPSGPFANDIASTAQHLSFESRLREMQQRAQGQQMMDAYFNSADPSSFNSTPPAITTRRR